MGRTSCSSPANASMDSDSIPTARSTRKSVADSAACSKSAVLPTPASPRTTSAPLRPSRASAKSASSRALSCARPRSMRRFYDQLLLRDRRSQPGLEMAARKRARGRRDRALAARARPCALGMGGAAPWSPAAHEPLQTVQSERQLVELGQATAELGGALPALHVAGDPPFDRRHPLAADRADHLLSGRERQDERSQVTGQITGLFFPEHEA